jgi:hypothetical protein
MLNQKWHIGALQALYRKTGTWYHCLEKFPGALCDQNGYVLFKTREQYENCSYLQIGVELTVPNGIAAIPGYVRVESSS